MPPLGSADGVGEIGALARVIVLADARRLAVPNEPIVGQSSGGLH